MTATEILMTVEYCCAANANTVLSALSLPLIAFSGSAKCSEPGPHPVHTQTGGAGERVRHAAVSRSVCHTGGGPRVHYVGKISVSGG